MVARAAGTHLGDDDGGDRATQRQRLGGINRLLGGISQRLRLEPVLREKGAQRSIDRAVALRVQQAELALDRLGRRRGFE